MTRISDRDEGFTLLEMLIAFLILSTALVVANQSVSSTVKAFSATKDINVADRLASEILAERFDDRQRTVGEDAGEPEDGYRWRIRREPISKGAAPGQAMRLSVSVLTPQGKIVRSYVTYFPASGKEQSNGTD